MPADHGVLDRVLARLDDATENILDPQAAAAIARRLLIEHVPDHHHAGVLAHAFGPDRCVSCRDGGPMDGQTPIHRWRQDMPKYGWSDMHCHGPGSAPFCEACPSHEGVTPWPCQVVLGAAATLGVEVS